jgi:predicted transcriptional regulator
VDASDSFYHLGQRFAQVLLRKEKNGQVTMTHEQIVLAVNAKREAISRVLKQLEKKGMIQRSCNCMTILDPHGLKQLL